MAYVWLKSFSHSFFSPCHDAHFATRLPAALSLPLSFDSDRVVTWNVPHLLRNIQRRTRHIITSCCCMTTHCGCCNIGKIPCLRVRFAITRALLRLAMHTQSAASTHAQAQATPPAMRRAAPARMRSESLPFFVSHCATRDSVKWRFTMNTRETRIRNIAIRIRIPERRTAGS